MSPQAGPPAADAPTDRAVLLPPRPIPGPEPLDEATPAWPWAVGLVAVVLGLAAWRAVRRLRGGRASARKGGSEADVPTTPRERVVALSSRIRSLLAARFDETWLAKTTEEIAASAALTETFGAETADRLVAFLRAADRVKFAPEGQGGEVGDGLEWASEFVSAGASSTTNGK